MIEGIDFMIGHVQSIFFLKKKSNNAIIYCLSVHKKHYASHPKMSHVNVDKEAPIG